MTTLRVPDARGESFHRAESEMLVEFGRALVDGCDGERKRLVITRS